jgi:hypothetical protein
MVRRQVRARGPNGAGDRVRIELGSGRCAGELTQRGERRAGLSAAREERERARARARERSLKAPDIIFHRERERARARERESERARERDVRVLIASVFEHRGGVQQRPASQETALQSRLVFENNLSKACTEP